MPLENEFGALGGDSYTSGPRTLDALAAALGISYRTLMAWKAQGCRIERWPDGSFNVSAVRAWRRRKPSKADPRTGKLFGRKKW